MKKLIWGIISLCLCTTSLDAEAKDIHTDVMPGDCFSYKYTVENSTKNDVKVRLVEVKNGDNSELYEVLDASLNGNPLVELSELNSEWYELKPGEKYQYVLDMYFREDSLNEYQGKNLSAKAVFQTETGGKISTYVENGGAVIKTGDYDKNGIYVVLFCLSAVILGAYGYGRTKRKTE